MEVLHPTAEPLIDANFTVIDVLTKSDKANHDSPIMMTVHDAE